MTGSGKTRLVAPNKNLSSWHQLKADPVEIIKFCSYIAASIPSLHHVHCLWNMKKLMYWCVSQFDIGTIATWLVSQIHSNASLQHASTSTQSHTCHVQVREIFRVFAESRARREGEFLCAYTAVIAIAMHGWGKGSARSH